MRVNVGQSVDSDLCRKGVQILRVIFSEGGAGASSPTGSPSASSRFAPPPAAVSRLAPAVRAQVREAFEDVAGEAALIDRQLARVAVRILTRTTANRRGVPLREDELDAMMARASALVEGRRKLTLGEFEAAVAPYL